jgi:hypothetical protein
VGCLGLQYACGSRRFVIIVVGLCQAVRLATVSGDGFVLYVVGAKGQPAEIG